jgi:hypothetical protein
MGLNYGFDIFCDRSKVWQVIDAIVELSEPVKGRHTTIIWGEEQKTVPLWLPYNKTVLSLDDPDCDDGFCLSLPFVVDAEIEAYLWDEREAYRRQNPQADLSVPRFDEQGRVLIGCVYFYINSDLDAIERTGYDEGLIWFQFRAATNRMSQLFEASKSVRETFLRLAKSHDAVYCLFSRGGQGNPHVLWLDGQEYDVPIADDWLPMSEVRRIVRS